MLLAGTTAAPFLAQGSEEQFAGTRSTASDAVAGLEYVAHGPPSNAPLSVMEWAKSNQPGWLFLPYQADQTSALKRLIAAWMRLAISATMSRGEGDSRTWFVVDELDALGKIDGFADALQRLRKFGRRCVLGFQSVGPLYSIYGEGFAAALIENTGSKLILRCSASEGGGTAAFASQIIGKRDVWRSSSNTGISSQTHMQGMSSGRSSGSTQSIVTEDAVLATQIENLPDLTGYITTPSVAGCGRGWGSGSMGCRSGIPRSRRSWGGASPCSSWCGASFGLGRMAYLVGTASGLAAVRRKVQPAANYSARSAFIGVRTCPQLAL